MPPINIIEYDKNQSKLCIVYGSAYSHHVVNT